MKNYKAHKDNRPDTVNEPDLSGTYTAADYLQWKMEEFAELIRGKIFKMSPAPSRYHQNISREILRVFLPYFSKKCELFHPPFDVYLVKTEQHYKKTKNIVEPDLCVVCDDSKLKDFGCVGAPDLVVEILSPSTQGRDQKDKFELYEEYGVREYWIVSPENRSVILNVLEDGKYKTLRPRIESETLQSVIFPDLKVELKEVFKDVKYK
ncbi:MAG: Uma2 family endonuclease [Chitinophagales bacterium]